MACIAQDQLQAISVLKTAYQDHIADVNPDYLLANNVYEGQTMVGDLSAAIKDATSPADLESIKDVEDQASPLDRFNRQQPQKKKKKTSLAEEIWNECIPCDKSLFTALKHPFGKHGAMNNLIGKLFVDPYTALALKQLEIIAGLKQYLTGNFLFDELCNALRALPPIVCIPDLLAMLAAFMFQLNKLKGLFKKLKVPTIKFDLNAVMSFVLMPFLNALMALLKQLMDLLLKPLDCVLNAMKLNQQKINNSLQVTRQYSSDNGKPIYLAAAPLNIGYTSLSVVVNPIVDILEKSRTAIIDEFTLIENIIKGFIKDKLKKDKLSIDKLVEIKHIMIYIRILNALLTVAKLARSKKNSPIGKALRKGDFLELCRRITEQNTPLAQIYQKNVIEGKDNIVSNFLGIPDGGLNAASANVTEFRQDYWNNVNKVDEGGGTKRKYDSRVVTLPPSDEDSGRDFNKTATNTAEIVFAVDPSIPNDFFSGTEIDEVLRTLPFDINSLSYEDGPDGTPDPARLDMSAIQSYIDFKQRIANLGELASGKDSGQALLQKTLNDAPSQPTQKGIVVGALVLGTCFKDNFNTEPQLQEWIKQVTQ